MIEQELSDLMGYYTAAFRQLPHEFMAEILDSLDEYDYDLCQRFVSVLTQEEQNQLKNYMIKRIGE